MSEPAFELTGVGKRYGSQPALEDVTLSAPRGELMALVGPNGAGKTTLMKLILGLIAPTSGSVRTLGADPATRRGAVARHALGFLPENVVFDPAMTGRETLRFYARLKRVGARAGEPLLERVGLAHAADRRIATYSKGMRQRLGLAQALLGEPRLLLLDEPTTGLDPGFRRSFYELLDQTRGRGTTILLSSHALTELEARADRVAAIGGGRLVAFGTLQELRAKAGLPVMLRVRVEECQTGQVLSRLEPAAVTVRERDERTLVLACRPDAKMSAIRTLAACGDIVQDVETVPPALDDLYGHFLREGEAR